MIRLPRKTDFAENDASKETFLSNSKLIVADTFLTSVKLKENIIGVDLKFFENDCVAMFPLLSSDVLTSEVKIEAEQQIIFIDFQKVGAHLNDPSSLDMYPVSRDSQHFTFYEQMHFDRPVFLNIFCPFWVAGKEDPSIEAWVYYDLIWNLPYHFGN